MHSADLPDVLTTKEAARYLRLSHRTLEGLRRTGGGPQFYLLAGGQVRYLRVDLQRYLWQRPMRAVGVAARVEIAGATPAL